jgi:hypothetical protein
MQISIQADVTPPRWLRTKTRRKVAALAVAAVLLIPGSAFAIHDFTDVPNSSSFHTNISRVYGARITNGCTATTYCPSTPVSREQMAAFLARSSGRVVSDESSYFVIPATEGVSATVTIRAGDVTGGLANIMVQAHIQGYTYSLPSDGMVSVRLFHGDNPIAQTWLQIPKQVTSTFGMGSASVTSVVAVPTGVNQTFTLRTYVFSGAASQSGLGSLTATYIPFGGLGENPSFAAPAVVPNTDGPPRP